MVFDMATASMAKGEVMIAARDGHIFSVRVWWDENVNPSNGPKEILKGVLLPFGGYKSDGIALMVKLFAARLDRRFFSYQAEENDNGDGARPKRGRDSLL